MDTITIFFSGENVEWAVGPHQPQHMNYIQEENYKESVMSTLDDEWLDVC